MDVGSLPPELASNPIAQLTFLVLSVVGAVGAWRLTGGTAAKQRADSEGQIAALETWKQLVATEREARVRAEERADEAVERAEAFSEERNKAMEALWEIRGQLRSLQDTINKQNEELIRLRNQIRELEGKINGTRP